jgi:hypothetical protein
LWLEERTQLDANGASILTEVDKKHAVLARVRPQVCFARLNIILHFFIKVNLIIPCHNR